MAQRETGPFRSNRGAIRASVVVLTGCGVLLALAVIAILRSRREVKMNSTEALAAISSLHGVAWPSNATTTAFVIWRYRAASDQNSRNTETLAKLEANDDSFANWYSSATNVLSEHPYASAPENGRLSAKAKWWAPNELDGTNEVILSHDMSQSTGVSSKLRLFIGASGTNHVIYVHCHVRQP